MTNDIVSFVENALEASSPEVMRKIAAAPGAVLARKVHVLDLLQEAWRGRSLSELTRVEPGALRPVFSGSVQGVAADAVSSAMIPGGRTAPELAARRRTELQTLLLYAHAVAIPNPLQPAVGLGTTADDRKLTLKQANLTDEQFLMAIYSICDLDRLTRNGIVQYFEPIVIQAESISYDLDDIASGIGRALYASYAINDHDQAVMKRTGIALLEQVVGQLAFAADFTNQDVDLPDLLVPTDLDEPTFAQIVTAVGAALGTASMQPTTSRDGLALSQLLKLALPGVQDIRLKDVANIRQDDAFALFRSDMRQALDLARQDGNGTDDSARHVIAEEMVAASQRLESKTIRGVISDSLAAGVVGWAVGSSVSPSGWLSGAASLTGRASVDMYRKFPKASKRALKRHYVALSDRRLPRPSVKYTPGNEYVDRFWQVGAPSQISRIADQRRAALDDGLAALEEG